jgi:hypothetical protein
MRETPLGNCKDSDVELAVAWIGWQAAKRFKRSDEKTETQAADATADIVKVMTPALLRCAASGSGWHHLEATFRNDSGSLYVLDFHVRPCESTDFGKAKGDPV